MADINHAIVAHDFEAAYKLIDDLVERPNMLGAGADAEPPSLHLNTRGWLNVQLGRYPQALADTQEARRMDPNLDQHNLMLARLFERHRESVFEPEMEKLRHGLSAEPCRNIALAYYSEGFYANAASYLNLAIAFADRSELAGLYNELSGAYLGSGLFIDAFQAASKALALDPGIDQTNRNLALAEFRRIGQDPAPFSVVASQAAAQPAEQGDAAEQGGTAPPVDSAAGPAQRDSAIAAAQAKSGGGDDCADLIGLLTQRARARLDAHDFAGAAEDFLEVRRLDQSADQQGLRLAQFFRDHFDALLKPLFDQLKTEISAETYNKIGLVFFQNRFQANAVTYFQLAVALSEGLVRAESLNNLAGAYLNSLHPIEALRAGAQALALNPQISKTNHSLATMPLKLAQLDLGKLEQDRFGTLQATH